MSVEPICSQNPVIGSRHRWGAQNIIISFGGFKEGVYVAQLFLSSLKAEILLGIFPSNSIQKSLILS